jgi:mRNA interferase RelE/StbE
LTWIVKFKESAKKELSKLDKPIAKKLVQFLQNLGSCEDPRQKGKQLKGKLKEFWRYRVGDYRIIAKITDQEITILVLKVAHRKDVYEDS